MLTTGSYLTGLAIYLLSAMAGLMIVNRWWLSALASRWQGLWLGLMAGALITPAHPNSETLTWAPALIVGSFNFLFDGGLSTALVPLVLLTLGMALCAVVGWVWGGRRERNAKTALSESEFPNTSS
jgi:hypothetical protein